MSDSKLLVLVDGSALAFRSFYALYRSGLKTPTGEPSWAVYGFFKALLDLIEKQKPDMVWLLLNNFRIIILIHFF